MQIDFTIFSRVSLLLILVGGVEAGTVAGSDWSPSGCGAAPKEYKLDLSNPDAYNKSVEGVNAYRQAARDYVDCLAKEANSDIQTITRSAKTAQQAALDADKKILEDVKAADKKFGQ